MKAGFITDIKLDDILNGALEAAIKDIS